MNKVEFSRSVKSPFAKRYDNYVGGKRAAPASGRYFDNFSPVNGQLLCEVARPEAADVDAAPDAAHAARDAWGKTSAAEGARGEGLFGPRQSKRPVSGAAGRPST